MTVTAAAIPIVRRAIVRYVGSENSVLKFWSVNVWTTSLVNGSTRQNAEMNRTTSAAM